MRSFIKSHKYFWIVPAYGLFYILAFIYVENNLPDDYVLIHTAIDDMIPFFEGFIILYYYWFLYMAVTIYFIVNSGKENFLRTAILMMIGMTLFVIVSIVYPNGHDLRPSEFARDNFFVKLTKFIYSTDPPRNILPSIHVFNSIGCHIGFVHAIRKMEKIKHERVMYIFSLLSCVLICVSTLFVKQHSIIDVGSAMLLSVILYFICFKSKIINRFT